MIRGIIKQESQVIYLLKQTQPINGNAMYAWGWGGNENECIITIPYLLLIFSFISEVKSLNWKCVC